MSTFSPPWASCTDQIHDQGLQRLDLGRPDEMGLAQRRLGPQLHLVQQVVPVDAVRHGHIFGGQRQSCAEPCGKHHGLDRRAWLDVVPDVLLEGSEHGLEGRAVAARGDGVDGLKVPIHQLRPDGLRGQQAQDGGRLQDVSKEEAARRRNVRVARPEEFGYRRQLARGGIDGAHAQDALLLQNHLDRIPLAGVVESHEDLPSQGHRQLRLPFWDSKKQTNLLGQPRPIHPPNLLGNPHLPNPYPQIHNILGPVRIILVRQIRRNHRRRLQIPLVLQLVIDVIRDHGIPPPARAAGTPQSSSPHQLMAPRARRRLDHDLLKVTLQRPHLLLHLRQLELAGLVELGADVGAVARELLAVEARRHLVALELAAAALEARRDHAHAPADGFGRGEPPSGGGCLVEGVVVIVVVVAGGAAGRVPRGGGRCLAALVEGVLDGWDEAVRGDAVSPDVGRHRHRHRHRAGAGGRALARPEVPAGPRGVGDEVRGIWLVLQRVFEVSTWRPLPPRRPRIRLVAEGVL